MRVSLIVVLVFVVLTCLLWAHAHDGGGHPVLLRNVDTLVFRDTDLAVRRRSPSVSALLCTHYPRSMDALPSTVTCRNTGWDGTDVTWQCSAELPVGVSLGNADVICEGYLHPNDPYITAGSCSLQYSLIDRRRHFDYFSSHLPLAPSRHPAVSNVVDTYTWIVWLPLFCALASTVVVTLCCVRLCYSSTPSVHYHPHTTSAAVPRYYEPEPTATRVFYGPPTNPTGTHTSSVGARTRRSEDVQQQQQPWPVSESQTNTHVSSVGARTHRSEDVQQQPWPVTEPQTNTHVSSVGARTKRI